MAPSCSPCTSAAEGSAASRPYTCRRPVIHQFNHVTLSKFCEFHDRFASILPDGLRRESGKLKADLVGRGLLEFRSKYLTHVWDNEANQPVPSSKVEEYVGRITGVGRGAAWETFLHQLASIDTPGDPTTVAGLLDRIENAVS